MNTEQKPLNRPEAERRYIELNHIIAVGAYEEDSEDGSLWQGDTNLDEELADLEARAAGEDLKFVATRIAQDGRRIYQLEELTEDEKKEHAAMVDAMRHAGLAAQFQWQDQGKIVLDLGTFVEGKLPGETPAYVVLVAGTLRENDPMMTYSWPAQEKLTVTWKQDGTPVIDDATDEQLAQIRAGEEAHSEAAAAIREWARQSYQPVTTEPEAVLNVRVDLLRLERKGDQWEALLAIAGGRFNLRVTFRLDAEKRLHIESQKQEYPEEA